MNTETIESDRKQAVQDIKCACEKIRNSPVANVERSEYPEQCNTCRKQHSKLYSPGHPDHGIPVVCGLMVECGKSCVHHERKTLLAVPETESCGSCAVTPCSCGGCDPKKPVPAPIQDAEFLQRCQSTVPEIRGNKCSDIQVGS